jgi:hypothetical protein
LVKTGVEVYNNRQEVGDEMPFFFATPKALKLLKNKPKSTSLVVLPVVYGCASHTNQLCCLPFTSWPLGTAVTSS